MTLPEILLLSPAKMRVRCHSFTKNKKKRASDLENGVYHTSNARTHAAYMLCSTTREGTQHSWVVPYEMYLSANI